MNSKRTKKLKQTHEEEKIQSLESLLKVLRKKNFIDQEASEFVERDFCLVLEENLFDNERLNENRNEEDCQYSDDIKQFAATLFFYSPKGYNYCKSILHLPHESIIRNWISSCNGEPGFLSDVFKEISTFPEVSRHCNLVFHSTPVRKDTKYDWESHQVLGNCNYGNKITLEGCETEATEVFIFMLVSLRDTWKWPVGYFFINRITPSVQAELIKTALIMAQQSGIKVWSVTCEGTPDNYSTMKLLGCNLYTSNYSDLKTAFKHPSSDYDVYFVPDVYLSMTYARLALLSHRILKSPPMQIKSSHITNLYELQLKLNLKSNERTSLINSKANIVKMELAAQTLNSSTASALEVLKYSEIKQFNDCAGTIKFIKVIDEIFDFLNSRNPFGKGFKEPIYYDNITLVQERIEEKIYYLYTLKNRDNNCLYCVRGGFVVSFAIAVKSILNIAKSILLVPSFKYLLTYRFSQDHLTLFFAQMRQKYKLNDYSMVIDFKPAMKSFLINNSISTSGSCVSFDVGNDIRLKLTWPKNKKNYKNWHNTYMNSESWDARFDVNDIKLFLDTDNIELYQSININNNFLKENILHYITGFIVKKLMLRLTCKGCIANIIRKVRDKKCNFATHIILISLENNRDLMHASHDVLKIVCATETEFLILINESNNKLLKKDSFPKIAYRVTRKYALDTDIFYNNNECLEELEVGIEVPHRLQLINIICLKYLTLRMYLHSKTVKYDLLRYKNYLLQLAKDV